MPITAEQALRFVLANEAISVPIPGMMRVWEVEENAQGRRKLSLYDGG